MGRVMPWLVCFLVLVFAEPALADERYVSKDAIYILTSADGKTLALVVFVIIALAITLPNVLKTTLKSLDEAPTMTDSEYTDLLQQLEGIGIFPTHSNGIPTYNWDGILDRLYSDSGHNELYRRIVQHYQFLKRHHVVLKEQTIGRPVTVSAVGNK